MPSDARWDHDDPDLLPVGDDVGAVGLEALDSYASAVHDGDSDWDICDSAALDDDTDPSPLVLFTVTSPTGGLSATAMLGGRLRRVDIIDVSKLDGPRLGADIAEVATLATEKARAAQHEVIVELMRSLGHDRVGVSAFLKYSIGLPPMELVNARLAKAHTSRYHSDDY